MSTRVKIIAGLAALLLALWSGAWFYARARVLAAVDPALAEIARGGTRLACPDRSLGGWPFSLALSCRSASATLADGSRIDLAGLTLALAASHWHGLAFSADGPMAVTRPGGGNLDVRFSRLSGQLALSGGDGTVTLRLADAGLAVGGRQLAPAPAELDLELKLTDALRALAGGPMLAAWQAGGGHLSVERFELALAGGRIDAAGTASVDAAGLVSGEISTTANGLEKIALFARKAGKPLSPPLAGLSMAYAFLGKPADDGGRKIVLSIDGGEITANGKALGRLPPLF